jgi:hypothetical protein
MRRLALRCVAGAAVLALALSGCSEEQPASDSLPTAGAEPTEDALAPLGPEDLPMPDEARTQDAAGAEAFVRYYIELINRTSTVMDADPLREFSEGCRDCDRIAGKVEEDASAGLDYEGGELTLLEVGAPLLEGETAQVALRADQAEFVVLDSSGEPTADGFSAFTNIPGGAAARWDGRVGSWLMTDLTFG